MILSGVVDCATVVERVVVGIHSDHTICVVEALEECHNENRLELVHGCGIEDQNEHDELQDDPIAGSWCMECEWRDQKDVVLG